MEISILLAQNIISMFLMGIIGYIVVKIGLLKGEDSKPLSSFTVYVFCPCMMISSFQIDYTTDKMRGLLLAAAAAVVVHILFILGTNVLGKCFHFNPTEKASLIYSNAGNIIIPLVYAVLGKEWVFYSLAYIFVQNILIWTHGKLMISGIREKSIRKIICNPNIVAMMVGLSLFVLRLRLPSVLGKCIEGMGNMIGPASMLVIGMLFAKVDVKWIFRQKRIYLICFLRLVFFPAIIVLLIWGSGITSIHPDAFYILMVVLLASSAPVAAMVTQIAQVYGGDAKYASVINAMTVLFCTITMPVIVFFYEFLCK
ncbi:MAG: AEC family transporter [Lachnospiraceae bacterium]